MFSQADAQQVATYLSRLGIARVTGSLRIAGPFYYFANGYHLNLSPETSAAKLRSAFQRAGIRIEGGTVFGPKSGNLVLSHYSDELTRILLFQNAHSSNAVAEVVGESVSGALGIQDYLTHDFGLSESDVFVGRASGLEFNRITPRAAISVLRGLIAVLDKYSLKPEDIMPVAGVDSGTLRSRLAAGDVRGSVVAKTGTLGSTDRGVSTLVGIAHTRTDGPVLFAILDTGGGVHGYRRLQDRFIEAFLAEEGGGTPASRLIDALADNIHDCIVQVFNPNHPEPLDRVSD
jgi:D-alanyl-D-alanine carboxypeptidase